MSAKIETMKPLGKLLLVQPGRMGDILICLPIAEHFSRDYDVSWFCPSEFHGLFRNIGYCAPVEAATLRDFDRVVDLSFAMPAELMSALDGYNGHEIAHWWGANHARFDSFVPAKYELAGVPLEKRWKLNWVRDQRRENDLFDLLASERDYSLCHLQGSSGPRIKLNMEHAIEFAPVADFNVFDWYKIATNSAEIHCIDSCLCNFVDVIPHLHDTRKFFYRGRNELRCVDTLLRNNWIEPDRSEWTFE